MARLRRVPFSRRCARARDDSRLLRDHWLQQIPPAVVFALGGGAVLALSGREVEDVALGAVGGLALYALLATVNFLYNLLWAGERVERDRAAELGEERKRRAEAEARASAAIQAARKEALAQSLLARLTVANVREGEQALKFISAVPLGEPPSHPQDPAWDRINMARSALKKWAGEVAAILRQGGRDDLAERFLPFRTDEDLTSAVGLLAAHERRRELLEPPLKWAEEEGEGS